MGENTICVEGAAIPASADLLAWYDVHRRSLPWRAVPGEVADPYAIWLSEIMLQQTTVATVKGYFAAFLAAWPTVVDLAAAPVEAVMQKWAGLGYYSRARNLHAAARIVAASGGDFPSTESALRSLPGVGSYTAAAIAAIAFDRRAVVVDGNVERVISRFFSLEGPVRANKVEIFRLTDTLTPTTRCGDHAQAMMDLGATICTPRRPACVLCPLQARCLARQRGLQNVLPPAAIKVERPLRLGSVFYLRRDRDVLVRTRPPRGLLGGMTEFPGSAWDDAGDPTGAACPMAASYRRAPALVEHGFTHFTLRLSVHAGCVPRGTAAPADCRWIAEADLAGQALPTLMRKVAATAQHLLAADLAA